MPPVTSPRRTVLHSPPAVLTRPAPVPIPGAVPPLSSGSTSTFASTPPSAGTSLGSASLGSMGASLASSMARAHSHHSQSAHHAPSHGHHSGAHSLGHHAPYMVALAGWPEPVFVAEREAWDARKRSRPTTPTGFHGEVRDGVGCGLPASLINAPPANGIHQPQPIKATRPEPHHTASLSGSLGVKARDVPSVHALTSTAAHSTAKSLPNIRPNDPLRRSRPGSPTGFPTSSARDAPILSSGDVTPNKPSSSASTPPSTAPSHPRSRDEIPGPLSGPLARLALGDSRPPNPTLAARTVRRHMEKFGFADPRYGLNAGVIGRPGAGRPLRVAPAWTSSSSTPPSSTTHGHGAQPYAPHERVTHDLKAHPHPQPHPPSLGSTHQVIGAGRGRPVGPGPVRISRAAPEVWPPPGVVTQVYPRDPGTLYMPRTTPNASGARHGTSSGSGGASPTHENGVAEAEPASKAARTVVTEAKREREARSVEAERKSAERSSAEADEVKKVEGVPQIKVVAESANKPRSLRGVPMDVDVDGNEWLR